MSAHAPVPHQVVASAPQGGESEDRLVQIEAVGLLLLVAAWCWLFAPTLRWLAHTLGHEAFRLNLILIAGIAALVGKQIFDKHKAALSTMPTAPKQQAFRVHLSWAPVALVLGSGVAYLLLDRFWDVSILSATCFGLGSYGLLGLCITKARWRRGFPAALLLIAALPFGTHMDQLLGFPARVFTATWSAKLLAGAGIGSLSTQSILVLENGIAHVDLPCSGIKSLWSGCVFFLALTWIERVPMGVRWFASGLLFVAALLAANVARVCLLILIAVVAQQPHLAEIIHVPLGVIGFCVAGGIAYLLLGRRTNTADISPTDASKAHQARRHPYAASLGLLVLLAVVLLLSSLHITRPAAAKARAWSPTFASGFVQKQIPLTASEQSLFQRRAQARKMTFKWKGLRGSMLLVFSAQWRSHHPPEICLAGNGHKVSALRSIALQPGFSLRHIKLAGNNNEAIYWYQSSKRATDILMKRILGGLRNNEKRWVMVSLLFDRPLQPQHTDTKELFRYLYQRIQRSLQKPGETP